MLPFPTFMTKMRQIVYTGQYTKGEYVKQIESVAADFLGVRHVVAVNSCTTGLMLVLSCLALEGEVITPSFTFSATTQALIWNNLKPVFADIDPHTLNINPIQVEKAITKKTSAILATHIFGNPCPTLQLKHITEKYNIPVIYDAAHAFGSKYSMNVPVGCGGIAEVFSLSPSKVLTAGEGGLIATNDPHLAGQLETAREYGIVNGKHTIIKGLNGRMSEFNAAVALAHFSDLHQRLVRRTILSINYMDAFEDISLDYQKTEGSNFSYFVIKSVKRPFIVNALKKARIGFKTYFNPPVHLQQYFGGFHNGSPLPYTEAAAQRVLCIPMYASLSDENQEFIIETIHESL